MNLFTERHGMRKPIERTSTISPEMYALLFDCCEKYLDHLAWHLPEECPDGCGCCGLDRTQFHNTLKFEIPTLYNISEGRISKPESYYGCTDDYDQYALLDYIEYIGKHCKDITVGGFHSYFGHHHIDLHETDEIFTRYRSEINNIFAKTGLLYTLTADKIVERVLEYDTLSAEVASTIRQVKEPGIKDLLDEAVLMFRRPDPAARQYSVEKIWDALERLKTYYTTLDKKGSSEKIVNDVGNGQAEFIKLFDDEFKALTKIGNDFRIRHHETNKIDITDLRYFDYFFNRCMSLIALALQYVR